MKHIFFPLIVALFCGTTVFAQNQADRLASALHLDQLMGILLEEGKAQQRDLDETLLNNSGGAFFQAQVEDIYDPIWMQDQITFALQEHLTEAQMDQAIVFFESELGQTIVSLENSARQAIGDETIEQMARDSYAEADRETEFFKLIEEYIEVNDLIDQNVQGSLSADFNFFRGLDTDGVTSSDELMAELLSQKDSMTLETKDWVYSFLLMAYRPLDASEMRENIAFSRTETGRAMNRALFYGFDRMYDELSYRLGNAVAMALRASDL